MDGAECLKAPVPHSLNGMPQAVYGFEYGEHVPGNLLVLLVGELVFAFH
jgi:hypothetical protein